MSGARQQHDRTDLIEALAGLRARIVLKDGYSGPQRIRIIELIDADGRVVWAGGSIGDVCADYEALLDGVRP